MLKVLGCPFCGEKPVLTPYSHSYNSTEFSKFFELACTKCNYKFVDKVTVVINSEGVVNTTHDGVKEMIDKWNRRVDTSE